MASTASFPFHAPAQAQSPAARRRPSAVARAPVAAAGPPRSRRAYVLLPRSEAGCLVAAFHRFVELHGRALTQPGDGCRVNAVTCPSGETVMLALWSRHAAEEFDLFWRRYRQSFGPEHAGPGPQNLNLLARG